MGVPAFFRWLTKKYPCIVVQCTEEKARSFEENGQTTKIPVDTSLPNPNKIEFDNLYLDMNGIIHPCCHPEGKPAPKNEDEMMMLIFEYIDRLFSIVRPRRLLYMAIDGVAPRAKMNQQRSRRFRASKETSELREEIANVKDALRAKGMIVPRDKPAGEHFDSNCITPGTEFMYRLAECLRYYIHHRLNTDPGWANVMVILSDANVPGEGEHKIMDYIRRQRAHPDHDPNTHHCLCGADADLIMLGLATHEVNFTIIREEFKPNQDPTCQICGQTGHVFKDCIGLDKDGQGPGNEQMNAIEIEQGFIFLRLNVLREYLYHDLNMPNLPFQQDLERAIDDWVLMCFFVGNDFLPHLPSLEIREGAINKLISLYKKAVYKTGGYLTDSGIVNLARVQLILTDLGELEDQIFKNRRETDLTFKRRDADKRKRQQRMTNSDGRRWVAGRQSAPAASSGSNTGSNPRQSIEELEPTDDVKLWETGWKERYFENKFGIAAKSHEFRNKVSNEYVKGICWVLKYYYQGCASWNWYFPYHYAPFASDFIDIGDLDVEFETDSVPFRPMEQLMSVFPAASKQFLPPSWRVLMDDPKSPIFNFYPTNFRIDLNGKKFAWQGVALLPFVDEKLLLKTLEGVYADLTDYEKKRNVRGRDRLFVSHRYRAHDFLESLYERGSQAHYVNIDPKLTLGICGSVWCDQFVIRAGDVVKSPVPQLKDLPNNRAICVQYEDPQYMPGFIFPARRIREAIFPSLTLKPEDFARLNNSGQSYRPPQNGFVRSNLDNNTAVCQMRAGTSGYSQMPPPRINQLPPLQAPVMNSTYWPQNGFVHHNGSGTSTHQNGGGGGYGSRGGCGGGAGAHGGASWGGGYNNGSSGYGSSQEAGSRYANNSGSYVEHASAWHNSGYEMSIIQPSTYQQAGRNSPRIHYMGRNECQQNPNLQQNALDAYSAGYGMVNPEDEAYYSQQNVVLQHDIESYRTLRTSSHPGASVGTSSHPGASVGRSGRNGAAPYPRPPRRY